MKTPVELNSVLSNFFCYTPDLLYHLIRRDHGRLANETFTSICIVSFKQKLNGLKVTNWKGTEQNKRRLDLHIIELESYVGQIIKQYGCERNKKYIKQNTSYLNAAVIRHFRTGVQSDSE